MESKKYILLLFLKVGKFILCSTNPHEDRQLQDVVTAEDVPTTDSLTTTPHLVAARILFPPRSQTVLSDGFVVLVCLAAGGPPPEMFWKVNQVPVLGSKGRYTVIHNNVIEEDLVSGIQEIVLKVDRIRYRADNGMSVECVADNGVGPTDMANSSLTVISTRKESFIPPGFPVVRESSTTMSHTIPRSANLTLYCPATGEPPLTYRWYKDLLPVESILNSGALLIENATKSSSGRYMCSVQSPEGTAYSQDTEVFIGEPASLIHPPKDHRVIDGGRVTFYCHAAGVPRPKVSWKVKDVAIGDDVILGYHVTQSENGSSLVISHVNYAQDHKVEFKCLASNEMSETAVSGTALLEVYQTGEVPDCYPKITVQPRFKAVPMDHDTVLGCSAKGNPRPTISWLKDGVLVDTGSQWYSITDTGSLEITYMAESDEGWYECVAENSVGVAYSTPAYLYVQVPARPPEIISILPESPVIVSAGSDLTMTCIAVGSPLPYIEWSAGQTRLTDQFNIPTGRGTIEVLDVWQNGTYSCTASSKYGTVTRNVRVEVIGN